MPCGHGARKSRIVRFGVLPLFRASGTDATTGTVECASCQNLDGGTLGKFLCAIPRGGSLYYSYYIK